MITINSILPKAITLNGTGRRLAYDRYIFSALNLYVLNRTGSICLVI